MRGQFEGALYSRVRFNSTDHAAKPRHIVKLDRKILMQEVLLSWPHCALNSRARCISLASKQHTRSIRGRGLFGGRKLFEEIRYV